jgi:hypothetical protein
MSTDELHERLYAPHRLDHIQAIRMVVPMGLVAP